MLDLRIEFHLYFETEHLLVLGVSYHERADVWLWLALELTLEKVILLSFVLLNLLIVSLDSSPLCFISFSRQAVDIPLFEVILLVRDLVGG